MKKTYIQPAIEVAQIELQSMMANSQVTGRTVFTDDYAGTDVAGLSRHNSVWGDEDEEY